jgi:hypothetical protein
VGIELQEIGAGKLACADLLIERHHGNLDTTVARRRRGLPGEGVVPCFEVHLALALAGGRQHELGIHVPRTILPKRWLMNRLSFDEEILALGEVAHQGIGPTAVGSANIDDGPESMLATCHRAKRALHRAPRSRSVDANEPVPYKAQ